MSTSHLAPLTSHLPLSRHGVTLIELILASTISLVVILAVGQLDSSRMLLSQQVRDTSSSVSSSEAQFAMFQFVRDAQQADRINRLSASDVQLRIPQADCNACPCTNSVPTPACFDVAANYRWVEYKLAGTEIRFYDDTANGCGVDRTFHDITGVFSVGYLDAVDKTPPGGEPFSPALEDNNVLRVTVTTANAQAPSITYEDTVTIRAGAYTNVNATAGGDSGWGLDVTNQSRPPPPCV